MEGINQTIEFIVSPQEFYDTIMNSARHSAFTQSIVEIEDKEGTPFSAYDGYIEGKNIELLPGRLIIQSWRADEEGWPDNHFSKITFLINASPRGCIVEFSHEGIPDGMGKMYEEGWKENYWDKLKEYFEQ